MASAEKRTPQAERPDRTITRTYRTAVKIGEDFITLEETISLPIDASDEEVTQAVDLGWRIYRAQRAAVEEQIAHVREHGAPATPITIKDPDSPASDKQRHYIAALQEDLTWSSEQIGSYAREQQIDLVTMTKGQASSFIDGLKRLAEDRASYETPQNGAPGVAMQAAAPVARTNRPGDNNPAADKQIQALERIAQQKGLDLDMETRRRFGAVAHGLTFGQASELLSEWQRRA
jgi:hypothetical protein